ncbi:MAG: hypothetical protein R3F34_14295 [Planctomycetota bacterium]
MRPRDLLLVLAGIVFGAMLTWFALPRDGGSAGLEHSANQHAASKPSSSSEPRLAEGAHSSSSSDGGASALEVPRAAIDAAARDARRSVASPAAGDGVIEGDVWDEVGRPIVGARVAVRREIRRGDPRADVRRDSANPFLSLEQRLEREGADWADEAGRTATVVTDANGHYRAEGLAFGVSYRVSGMCDTHVLEEASTRRSFQAGDVVNLVGRPIRSVEVLVRNEDGSVAESAILQMGSGASRRLRSWTPTDRVLELLDTEHELTAYGDVMELNGGSGWTVEAGLRSETVTVDTWAGVEHVDLPLAAGTGVVVRLVSNDGSPVDDSVVFDVMHTETRGGRTQIDVVAHSYTRGGARFYGIEPGTYVVRARLDNKVSLPEQVVELAAGELRTVEFVVERSEPHLILARVHGPDGAALDSVSFEGKLRLASSTWNGAVAYELQRDGSYLLVLDGLPEFTAGDPVVRHTLEVRRSGFGECVVQFDHSTTELDILLEPVAFLDVTVVGWNTLDPKLSSVTLEAVADEDGVRPSWRADWRSPSVDAEGHVRYENLPTGRYCVQLRVGGQLRGTANVELASGPNAIEFVPEARHDLVVHAPYLAPGTSISVSPPRPEDGSGDPLGGPVDEGSPFARYVTDGRHASAKVDDEHRATFTDLAPGEYVVSARVNVGDSPEPLRIVVPCGEVLYDARTPNALRITVFPGDGGVLGAAGFRDEDLVVGRRDAGDVGLDALFMDLTSRSVKSEVEFLVLRDGEYVTVTFGPLGERIQSPAAFGGTFDIEIHVP